jgi:hypothetical protein
MLVNCHPSVQHKDEPRITDPKKLAALQELIRPESYLKPEDQAKAARIRNGYSGPMPCEYETMERGVAVITGPPVDRCFKMTKPQHWQGLWRNNFESSQFCVVPLERCPDDDPKGFVWLNFQAPLPGVRDTPPGGVYAVDFVGRKTAYPGTYDGGAPEEIVVDRLISVKLVKAPPSGQMAKGHIEAYLKDCAGKPICMPNSEVPVTR